MTFKIRLSIGLILFLAALGVSYGFMPQPDFSSEMASEESVATDAPLVLHFAQSMNRGSVEAGFKISPALSGNFNWSDSKTLEYHPNSPLKIGDQYHVRVLKAARSFWGKSFLADRTAEFIITGPPFVQCVTPNANPGTPLVMNVDQPITLGFDRPMQTDGDRDHFLNISPSAEGELNWINPQVFVFIPKRWNDKLFGC